MKRHKLYISVMALSIFATSAVANGKRTVLVKYPEKYCDEIVSQEYSTGGGKTPIQLLEILCKDSEGSYRGFVGQLGSSSGLFGLGRYSYIKTFIYQPHQGERLVLERLEDNSSK